jgi:hypothetical protein
MSRKLLSRLLGARRKGKPIEPKNLYDGYRHAVSHHGGNASAADHLRMAGGDRRLGHSVLGKLAGRSRGRFPRILRLHAEQVAQWSRPTCRHEPLCRDNRSVLYQRVPGMFSDLALARRDGRYPRLMRGWGWKAPVRQTPRWREPDSTIGPSRGDFIPWSSRSVADSPLERKGFELLVPPAGVS